MEYPSDRGRPAVSVAASHRYYLCQIGDWTWDYGESEGDDLEYIRTSISANDPSFINVIVMIGDVVRRLYDDAKC